MEYAKKNSIWGFLIFKFPSLDIFPYELENKFTFPGDLHRY